MKKIIIFAVVFVFLLAIPFAAMAQTITPMGVEAKGFYAVNSSHTQQLGGNSMHAAKGLAVAALHSQGVVRK